MNDIYPSNLRTIKTARDEESINQGAKDGFMPLLKRVIPSPKIKSKYCVLQNKTTGEIIVAGDYRMTSEPSKLFEVVIDWTDYFPNNFPSPFAAYLIPKNIKAGEKVFLEDIIEDFVGTTWNQGDTYRLESCEAIWNGKDFEIQYDANSSVSNLVG